MALDSLCFGRMGWARKVGFASMGHRQRFCCRLQWQRTHCKAKEPKRMQKEELVVSLSVPLIIVGHNVNIS
jgi:hypothetical protein